MKKQPRKNKTEGCFYHDCPFHIFRKSSYYIKEVGLFITSIFTVKCVVYLDKFLKLLRNSLVTRLCGFFLPFDSILFNSLFIILFFNMITPLHDQGCLFSVTDLSSSHNMSFTHFFSVVNLWIIFC
jgi:hypothetical protein